MKKQKVYIIRCRRPKVVRSIVSSIEDYLHARCNREDGETVTIPSSAIRESLSNLSSIELRDIRSAFEGFGTGIVSISATGVVVDGYEEA